MEKEPAKSRGLELIKRSKIAIVGSLDAHGYPVTKAMFNAKHDGLSEVWFSTNTSSKRVGGFRTDRRASVYYVDEDTFEGLLLVGTIELLQDEESRRMLWVDGCEKYYPQGVYDPDYTVMKFTAVRGNYYHGLRNIDFEVR